MEQFDNSPCHKAFAKLLKLQREPSGSLTAHLESSLKFLFVTNAMVLAEPNPGHLLLKVARYV